MRAGDAHLLPGHSLEALGVVMIYKTGDRPMTFEYSTVSGSFLEFTYAVVQGS